MAQTIMMQLGDYQFGISSAAYQEFQRSTAYAWAAQPRFGKDDALQATGYGEDTITLPGVIFPEFAGGLGQIDGMRAEAEALQLLPLVDGLGRSLGDWAILNIEERDTVFITEGIPLKMEFSIKLRRGPSDTGNGGLIESVLGAVSSGLPITSNLLSSARSLATTASNGGAGFLASLTGSLSSVTGFAAQLGTRASVVIGAVRGGMNAAKTLQNAGGDVGRILAGLQSVSGVAGALNGLVNVGGNVSRAAGSASSILKLAGVDLTAASVDPAAIAAVRAGMIGINQLNVLAVNVRATAEEIGRRGG